MIESILMLPVVILSAAGAPVMPSAPSDVPQMCVDVIEVLNWSVEEGILTQDEASTVGLRCIEGQS